jgi:serine protease 16
VRLEVRKKRLLIKMAKLLLVICSLIAVCAAKENIFYSEKYVKLPEHVPAAMIHNGSYFPPLDHFRAQDNRTAHFHYRLNLDHYREDGPIFIFINSADETTTEWIEAGLVVDVARETGGALVTADHRYVRLNIPTETASFEDLQFLSVEQAVADIASLVVTLYDHLGKNNDAKVFLWGTGYGAALATFARKKFPHLIDGVFASSGTFRAEIFDTSYHDALSSNLHEHGGAECHLHVRNAFDVLLNLFENNQTEYITERLRLCNPIDPDEEQDVALLFELFIDLISNHIRRLGLFGITTFCRDIEFYDHDTLNSLIRWAVYVYGFDDGECIDTNYPDLIGRLALTPWDGTNYDRLRSYAYLRCSQIAAFRITSDFEMTAFPQVLDEEYHYQFCEDIFGDEYNRHALPSAVQHLNDQFGGQQQVVPFVIFTNAGLDPWIGHGVSEYDVEDGEVIFIYFSPAGADLSSLRGDDSAELYRAKQRIFDTLVRWAGLP